MMQQLSPKFTIGADPEFFVEKDGKPFSAYGLVPGTKEAPFKCAEGALQVDGMALELNVDPCDVDDYKTFDRRLSFVQEQLIAKAKEKDPGVTLKIASVQDFGEEYMASQPEEAKILGCDPDWNAYTMAPNPAPPADRPFRTASGHIHIGWGSDLPAEDPDHIEICAGFVKILDCTVGLFTTMIEDDPRRRELYGKAGAFRPKPYGCEYRTPSNVWLTSKARRELTQRLVNKAIAYRKDNMTVEMLTGYGDITLENAINTGDKSIADFALKQYILNSEELLLYKEALKG